MLHHSPHWSWDENARRQAFAVIFPGKTFGEGKLEKVMTVLHRLARQFVFIHPQLDESQQFRQLLGLARFSRLRGLNNRFQNTMQKLREQVEQSELREDLEILEKRYEIELEQYEFENLSNQKRGDLNIPDLLEAFYIFFQARKTNLLNRFMIQQRVAYLESSDLIQSMLQEPIRPERLLDKSPVLKLQTAFVSVFQLEKPEREHFTFLAQLLQEMEMDIHEDLLKTYFALLRGCCTLLVNSGQSQFLPTLFNIQKEHLTKGYMYYDNQITPSAFLNTINVALRVGEFDWAFDCIQSHADRILGDNENQDYYRFNLSNYYYRIGKFGEALDTLPHSLADFDYHLMARGLELKIYYSLHSELLPYKIDAFKMYLSRSFQKPLPAIQKERYGNFINLLHQLSNTIKGDQTRIQRLIARIQAKTWLHERDWLLEKANELL
ncbi:MAG: hypothetical protein U0U46_10820 [Saprospiraceae bacterium]|nr:hypothetical protein [Saprospiraceae bacterium]